MSKVRGVTGGGYDGNKVSHVGAPKREPNVFRASPGAASRLGNMVGVGADFKALQTQGGYSNPVGPSDGMGQGPGANRVCLPRGTQGVHGASVSGVARPGADRPVLPGFPGRR
jgi:hypothetical protein